MRFLFFAFLLFSSSTFGQKHTLSSTFPKFEFGVMGGVNVLTNRKDSLNKEICFGVVGYASINFQIGERNELVTFGLQYHLNRFIIDHQFEEINGKTTFVETPDGYKLNSITVGSIDAPILVRFITHGSPNDGICVGVGPYIGYVVQRIQQYEASNTMHRQKSQFDNYFQWGINLDVGTIGRANNRTSLGRSFGFGLKYQISDYLSNERSFRPLYVYFRFGLSK